MEFQIHTTPRMATMSKYTDALIQVFQWLSCVIMPAMSFMWGHNSKRVVIIIPLTQFCNKEMDDFIENNDNFHMTTWPVLPETSPWWVRQLPQ